MFISRFHRLTATLLVAAWIFAAGLPLVSAGHDAISDIACGEVGWSTSSTTWIGAPASPDGDGHCAACHLQRRLSQAVVSGLSAIHQPGWTVAVSAPVELDVIAGDVRHSSSRGPPSA